MHFGVNENVSIGDLDSIPVDIDDVEDINEPKKKNP